MKKLLFLLLVILSGQAASAQRRLAVRPKTGATMYFSLASEPQVTFEKTSVHIAYESTSVDVPLDELHSVFYDDDTSLAIGSPAASGLTLEERDGAVTLLGLPAGAHVRLFDASGRLITNGRAEPSRPYTFSLRSLAKGIYILQVQQQTLILRKR